MEQADPTISVVTAVKNNLEGLKWTVASLQQQTWRHIEHIVIDAESTDGTLQFLSEYSPRYAVTSVSEPDSGIYDGMNKGFTASTGDIILFLNGGDRLVSPNTLEKVARDWQSHDWCWAIGGMNYVTEQGDLVDSYQPKGKLKAKVPLGLAFYPHPSTFFSANFYRTLDGYFDGYGWSADQELMIRAAQIVGPRILEDTVTDFAIGGAHTQGSYYDFFARYRKIRTDNKLMVANNNFADWVYTLAISNLWTLKTSLGHLKKRLSREVVTKF